MGPAWTEGRTFRLAFSWTRRAKRIWPDRACWCPPMRVSSWRTFRVPLAWKNGRSGIRVTQLVGGQGHAADPTGAIAFGVHPDIVVTLEMRKLDLSVGQGHPKVTMASICEPGNYDYLLRNCKRQRQQFSAYSTCSPSRCSSHPSCYPPAGTVTLP